MSSPAVFHTVATVDAVMRISCARAGTYGSGRRLPMMGRMCLKEARMRKTLCIISLAAAIVFATSTVEAAPNVEAPNYAVPAEATVGVIGGTIFGLGISEGWWGSAAAGAASAQSRWSTQRCSRAAASTLCLASTAAPARTAIMSATGRQFAIAGMGELGRWSTNSLFRVAARGAQTAALSLCRCLLGRLHGGEDAGHRGALPERGFDGDRAAV
jgi:hypothetical protein